MSNIDIIRAWKDKEYLNSLSEEQRSQLPENPAGIVELSDTDMEILTGGLAKKQRLSCVSIAACKCCNGDPQKTITS